MVWLVSWWVRIHCTDLPCLMSWARLEISSTTSCCDCGSSEMFGLVGLQAVRRSVAEIRSSFFIK